MQVLHDLAYDLIDIKFGRDQTKELLESIDKVDKAKVAELIDRVF